MASRKRACTEMDLQCDSRKLTIGLVRSEWHKEQVDKLANDIRQELVNNQVAVVHLNVPGSWELVYGCQLLISERQPLDAVIAVGALVKGETFHFEVLSHTVAHGLMELQLKKGVPVINAVLNCYSMEQLTARVTDATVAKSYAVSAMNMASFMV